MARDYYQVLNVPRNASAEEIKQAYRRLAREYHPDVRREDPQAEERFKEINEAFQVLSDPERRAQYDRFGTVTAAGTRDFDFGFGSPFEDLFDAFFGGVRTGAAREPGPERGSDLRYDLEISLEEAAHGAERHIDVARLETCPHCFGTGAEAGGGVEVCPTCRGSGQTRTWQRTLLGHFTHVSTCRQCGGRGRVVRNPCRRCRGTGRAEVERTLTVRIPAGVEDGMRLRLAGEGEAGLRGGGRGDLYVVIHIAPHPLFERRGQHLYAEIPITMVQAALGGTVEVPTLDGPERVTIPQGTQPGDVAVLRGKGMPDLQGRRGDLYVRWKVEIPRQLSREERRALLQFARVRGEHIQPGRRRIVDKVKDLLQ
ncbi:MAG: molecular chaperone DnaJ [Armatimonadota bacterium]|nr:molecular chaperone DnaJ [Armatimonadota bacterium]MDR5697262.1 molecular chaperone DnaJ [Armatimonadota bacterium]